MSLFKPIPEYKDRSRICSALHSQHHGDQYEIVVWNKTVGEIEIYEVHPNPRKQKQGLSNREAKELGLYGHWIWDKTDQPYSNFRILQGRSCDVELKKLNIVKTSSTREKANYWWLNNSNMFSSVCLNPGFRLVGVYKYRLTGMLKRNGRRFKLTLVHSIKVDPA